LPLAALQEEIRRFLLADTPEVICIKGKWGVGKTFAWNKYLRAARDANEIKLSRYSYVSLFGLNSLDELRYSIFENTIRTSEIGLEPSLETLNANAAAAAESLGRKSLWFLQQLPFVKSHIGGLGPVWYLSITRHIVCLDDIERKGRSLPIRDVFGLVSQLKEQKQCKVILILNDDALKEEIADFDAYFDKTIDASLNFNPTAEEATEIALPRELPGREPIIAHCISLGISNIRIIKRIERFVSAIEPILSVYDSQVFHQAMHSLTLLCWAKYAPDEAPSLEFIKNQHNLALDRAVQRINEKREPAIPPNEARWTAVLDGYNFSVADEFDLALLSGVENGFFEAAEIREYAASLDRSFKAGRSEQAAGEGWRLFHDSFGKDDLVIETMIRNTEENIQYITPINFNAIVVFLKELGRTEIAATLIDIYMQAQIDNPEFFDLSKYSFAREITDPELREAFGKRNASFARELDPTEILYKIGKGRGSNEHEIGILASLPPDSYYEMFKINSGEKLRSLLTASLQFGNFPDASEAMKQISLSAREALKRIGRESSVNAMRVRRYGIEPVESKEP
jgi:hypothetical protein